MYGNPDFATNPYQSPVIPTLSVPAGGTGNTSFSVGAVLTGNGTSPLVGIADVVVGNALISGGISLAPSWGKIDFAAHMTGILQAANFPALTGDVTTSAGSLATTLASVVSADTKTKITYNAKGLVTAGTQAAASDLSNGTTGSGSIMLSASPTTTGTFTADSIVATLHTVNAASSSPALIFNCTTNDEFTIQQRTAPGAGITIESRNSVSTLVKPLQLNVLKLNVNANSVTSVIDNTGIISGGGVFTNDTIILTSNAGFTDFAAANAGTLTNAPAAGNPTKWLGISDGGTLLAIPAWAV